jgi:hypothetical protein
MTFKSTRTPTRTPTHIRKQVRTLIKLRLFIETMREGL